jgi:L-threonylcarbamoyladenylate synthase
MPAGRPSRILEPDQLEEAARIIRAGGLVVFPTETVYGIGANAWDEQACRGIFRAKGRPADNPLIVHVAGPEFLGLAAAELPGAAARLVERFMPGPLTIVLPRSARIPALVTAGLPDVAVRVPAHELARKFLAACGVPVAAPSANRSGRPSPTSFAMARSAMAGRVDGLLRGGPCEHGLESTVIRLAGNTIEILRPGAVTEEDLRAAAPDFEVRAVYAGGQAGPPASPGMKYSHYQPRAKVLLWSGEDGLHRALAENAGQPVAVIGIKLPADLAGADGTQAMCRSLDDPAAYARELFSFFHEMDEAGIEQILAELPPERGLGSAIRNRLLKAAGDDSPR